MSLILFSLSDLPCPFEIFLLSCCSFAIFLFCLFLIVMFFLIFGSFSIWFPTIFGFYNLRLNTNNLTLILLGHLATYLNVQNCVKKILGNFVKI